MAKRKKVLRPRNFRVTIEQPRDIVMKNETDITVDRFVTYVYGVPNMAAVREVLTLPEKLKELRRQGLRITKPQMAKAALSGLIIERI